MSPFQLVFAQIATILVVTSAASAAPQEVIIRSDGDGVISIPSGSMKILQAPGRTFSPSSVQKTPPPQPPQDATKKKAESKDAKKPDAAKKKDGDKGPTTVKKPEQPKVPADPTELLVQPDTDGRISFSFKGQPWPEVLDWLAKISNLNLHWEEAPQGYLDYTTRGKYKVEEVRDRINSILLTKGFTLLQQNDLLIVTSVAKDKLDVSLVPRVAPEELEQRGRFEFVRTVFTLDWLVAAETAEEIRPMLSKHAAINPLKTTNRLDVMDTAGSLLRVRNMLEEEQSSQGQERLVKVFQLYNSRAPEVLEMLNSLLGLSSKPSGPMTPQQMQAAQQAAMRAAQAAAKNKTAPPKSQPKINLAINKSRNSIMANAPPDAMATIEQAIRIIDEPKPRGSSLLANLNRTRAYRLNGIDPEMIKQVLEDVGDLDPTTRLKVDANSSALIAYATVADHLTIQALVAKLDGSPRRFDVIQLYRLDAQLVSGTIQYLMNAEDEKSNDYDPYGFYRGRSSSRREKSKFRIEADPDNNQLWVYANEIELQQINTLLAQLNEGPESSQSASTSRLIPTTPGQEADLLETLQKIIPSVTPNPIEVTKPPTQPDPANETTETRAKEVPTKKSPVQAPVKDATSFRHRSLQEPGSRESVLELVANSQDGFPNQFENEFSNNSHEGAPIHLSIGPQGLVISSLDVEALNKVMGIVGNMMPKHSGRKVIFLKYVDSFDMELLLEEAFLEEDGSESRDAWNMGWYGIPMSSSGGDKNRRMSGAKLKFISDDLTNSIMVQGASVMQLREIEELINTFDRLAPPDSAALRQMRTIRLKHARADEVMVVIKEVLRDLLSPNDKEMAKGKEKGGENRSAMSFMYGFGGGGSSDSGDGTVRKFKSPLSLSVHQPTNTLIISATLDLLTNVEKLVEYLDTASEPDRPVVRMLQIGSALNPEKLGQIFGSGKAEKKSGKNAEANKNNQPQKGNPEGVVVQPM